RVGAPNDDRPRRVVRVARRAETVCAGGVTRALDRRLGGAGGLRGPVRAVSLVCPPRLVDDVLRRVHARTRLRDGPRRDTHVRVALRVAGDRRGSEWAENQSPNGNSGRVASLRGVAGRGPARARGHDDRLRDWACRGWRRRPTRTV